MLQEFLNVAKMAGILPLATNIVVPLSISGFAYEHTVCDNKAFWSYLLFSRCFSFGPSVFNVV